MNEQTIDWCTWQEEVIRELGVTRDFDVEAERERRINFLSNYLVAQGLRTFVLGSAAA